MPLHHGIMHIMTDDNGDSSQTSPPVDQPGQVAEQTTPAASGSSGGKVAEQKAKYLTGNTKVLKNGAIYSMDTKRIIGNPPGGPTTAITQSNVVEYHELSREKRLDAVYRGLAAGTRRANAHAAVEAIAAKQAELAMSIDRGRATEAARFVFQAGELIQDRRLDADGGVTVTAHASLGALEAFRAILEQARGSVVDGQLVDVDE